MQEYPKTMSISGDEYTFRLMTNKDRDVLLGMVKQITDSDLWFLRHDITQNDAIDDWIRDIDHKRAQTLIVEDNGKAIAFGILYYNQVFWNRHLAEMRVLVASSHRNRGLGTKIARELTVLAKDLSLEKVLVYMEANDKAARRMVEDLGFKPEAILSDWVKTRDDRHRDLLIMSTDLEGVGR